MSIVLKVLKLAYIIVVVPIRYIIYILPIEALGSKGSISLNILYKFNFKTIAASIILLLNGYLT